MLNEVLNKIKKIIAIDEFDNTNIIIDTDDKLPKNIILKDVFILITCVLKSDGKYYPQIFLEEALQDE